MGLLDAATHYFLFVKISHSTLTVLSLPSGKSDKAVKVVERYPDWFKVSVLF